MGLRLGAGADDITVLELIESVKGPTEAGRCVVADIAHTFPPAKK